VLDKLASKSAALVTRNPDIFIADSGENKYFGVASAFPLTITDKLPVLAASPGVCGVSNETDGELIML
jgi:hypothetical protein